MEQHSASTEKDKLMTYTDGLDELLSHFFSFFFSQNS